MVKEEKYLQKWLNLEYYVPTNMVKDEWRECPRSSSCQFRPQRTDKSAWPSRESEVTSSTFISNSKLLLQIFQTSIIESRGSIEKHALATTKALDYRISGA